MINQQKLSDSTIAYLKGMKDNAEGIEISENEYIDTFCAGWWLAGWWNNEANVSSINFQQQCNCIGGEWNACCFQDLRKKKNVK